MAGLWLSALLQALSLRSGVRGLGKKTAVAVGWPRRVRDGCKGLVGRAPGRSKLFPWGSMRRLRVMLSLGMCQGFSSRVSSPQPLWDRCISAAAVFAGRPRGWTRRCEGRADAARAGVNMTAKAAQQLRPTAAPSRRPHMMPAAFLGQEQRKHVKHMCARGCALVHSCLSHVVEGISTTVG